MAISKVLVLNLEDKRVERDFEEESAGIRVGATTGTGPE